MTNVLVVGSVALDTLETPHGRADDALGGSATHFALAASRFAPVRLVGVVGRDFPSEHLEMLKAQKIDLSAYKDMFPATARPGAELRGIRHIYEWLYEQEHKK